MSKKPRQLDVASLLAGMTVGAGAVLARGLIASENPERLLAQRLVNRALDSRLRVARERGRIRLDSAHRFVIFSDHHKGARNQADDFRQCEATYLAALDHYNAEGYTLVILGDSEELLEEDMLRVINAYENVFLSEARFHPDRLIRIYGNHDLAWQVEAVVRQYLDDIFPGIVFQQELLLEYASEEQRSGEIFLVHGYQGTLDSDIFSFAGKFVLPYYRNFQILTGLGRTSPSEDDCLRSAFDNRMYRWASKKGKLILIAGHTHRPVWSSMAHLEKLVWQLYQLQQIPFAERPEDYDEKVARLKQDIEYRREKYPPCTDMLKTRPCYFNSGCCRFEDGDITGIEIENGLIRLVKWGNVNVKKTRILLEETTLAEIFYLL